MLRSYKKSEKMKLLATEIHRKFGTCNGFYTALLFCGYVIELSKYLQGGAEMTMILPCIPLPCILRHPQKPKRKRSKRWSVLLAALSSREADASAGAVLIISERS